MGSKKTNNIIKLSYLSGIDIVLFAILGKLKLNRNKYIDKVLVYFINNTEKILIKNDIDLLKCVYLYNIIINKNNSYHRLPILVKIDEKKYDFIVIFKNNLKHI